MSDRFFIIGNCKQAGRLAYFKSLLSEFSDLSDETMDAVDFVLMPPVPYLSLLARESGRLPIQWGVQMVSGRTDIARTGSYNAEMVAELGARYACVGHSERRQYDRETPEILSAQYQQSVAAGLTPVLCIGETRSQRDAMDTLVVLEQQLSAVFSSQNFDKLPKHDIIVAYEPVWAIGAKAPASAEVVAPVFAWLHRYLNQCFGHGQHYICYGGSVNHETCRQFYEADHVSGLLIGRASLELATLKGVIVECSGC